MGLFDAFIGKDMLAKADAAVQKAEIERRERVRKALVGVVDRARKACLEKPLTKSFDEVLDVVVQSSLDEVLKASSQALDVKAISEVAGKNVIGEALGKIADKLA